MKKTIALFDFDGTMIKADSLPRFLWFCNPSFEFTKKLLFSSPVLLKYASGLLDNHTAKERIFAAFFTGVDKVEFVNKAVLFSKTVIPGLLRKEAVDRLRWHQSQKHQCVLVSASIEEYLIPWAQGAGFSHILATKIEVDGNCKLTGRFLGKNCSGGEKVRRIKEHFGLLEDHEIYAYGDSRGDEELLKIAHHPFYRSFKEDKSWSLCIT